jgi:hypothetical protein
VLVAVLAEGTAVPVVAMAVVAVLKGDSSGGCQLWYVVQLDPHRLRVDGSVGHSLVTHTHHTCCYLYL